MHVLHCIAAPVIAAAPVPGEDDTMALYAQLIKTSKEVRPNVQPVRPVIQQPVIVAPPSPLTPRRRRTQQQQEEAQAHKDALERRLASLHFTWETSGQAALTPRRAAAAAREAAGQQQAAALSSSSCFAFAPVADSCVDTPPGLTSTLPTGAAVRFDATGTPVRNTGEWMGLGVCLELVAASDPIYQATINPIPMS